MSAEWQSRKLSDLAQDITVGFVGSMSHLFLDSGVPLLRGQNIKPYRLDLTNLKYISTETHHKWKKSALKSGDVVIVRVGEPGTACVIPENIGELNAASLVIVRPEPSKLDSNYLCYVLNSTWGKSQISGRLVGSVQSVFNIGTATDMKIPYPYLAEQKAIAHILGTLDDKIELNRKMNETLEAMARALFKSWFVDFDPVRKKQAGEATGLPPEIDALFPSEFEDSALGKIPKGWRVGKLGDVSALAGAAVQANAISSGTPYIGLEHIPRKTLSLEEWGKSDEITSNKTQFRKDHILFGKLRPYFHKVIVAPFNGVCSTDILAVSAIDSAYQGFSAIHFSSEDLIRYADAHSGGTKMPRTNWDDLSKYEVVIPPKALAKAYNDFYSNVIPRMHAGIFQNKALAEHRDTLLPKLISGELRVSGSLMARING